MRASSLSLDRQAAYFQLTHASPADPRSIVNLVEQIVGPEDQ
jgi:hypothetical protein